MLFEPVDLPYSIGNFLLILSRPQLSNRDPAFAGNRVQQVGSLALPKEAWIPQLLDSPRCFVRLRGLHGYVRSFIGGFRLEHGHWRRCSPFVPIRCQGNPRQQDAFRPIANSRVVDPQIISLKI